MTLFISDVHLGHRHCRADKLLKFLNKYSHEKELYLVGDIFHDHSMRDWSYDQQEALSKIMKFERICFIPGNHDYWFQRLHGIFGHIQIIRRAAIYYTNKKEKFLVTHGHEQDWLMKYTHFISTSWLGKLDYEIFNKFHTHILGEDSHFQRTTLKTAKEIGANGIICGHSHMPMIKNVNDIMYINCGDWTDNYTGVVETNGYFDLIKI